MHLTSGDAALFVIAGFLAGIMNAVARGGTFLTFPALVFSGIPSVAANQTSTVAVFPGQVASFWAYRNILGGKANRCDAGFDEPLWWLGWCNHFAQYFQRGVQPLGPMVTSVRDDLVWLR
jgi:hypothetical protein